MKRSLSLPSLLVAAVLALSSCGSSSGTGMEGMGRECSSTASPSIRAGTTPSAGASDEAAAEPNAADVMFARMMIPHHEQAVEMSEMMLAKDTISPQITDLAVKIRDAQGPEIETMSGWLEAWGQPMDVMEGHDMGPMGGSGCMMGSMEGMLSEDEMSELESAQGTEAARIFLESMTAHHEGAVDMAQDEIDNGQNPEVIKLAERIIEVQKAEITEMKELLAGL